MSLKRGATTDLNHENWNKEEEPEEKGIFAQASSEELQNRVIRKAKRKLTSDDQNADNTNKTVFSGFKGFGSSIASASTVSSTSSPFSFLSKLSSSTSSSSITNSTSEKENKSETTTTTTTTSVTENQETPKDFQFNNSNAYYSSLKALNQSVSNWIKKHVDENPLCILTPVFKDYEKYLDEIKEKSKNGSTSEESKESTNFKIPLVTTTSNTAVSSSSTFTFGTVKPQTTTAITTESSTAAPTTKTTSSNNVFTSATFSFGQKSNEPTKSFTGFTFSSNNKPFTFGSQLSQQKQETTNNQENKQETKDDETGDGDDEPPKVEFTPITEEGSFYSKRCKVFIKNDNNYKDLGIGTLHLKKTTDGNNKTQLIVRADTNIGKILLNLILNQSIPTQRMGKNNVMMVCIPTPDPETEQKPVAILLRVKTGEEADELLETIQKYKK